MKIKYLLLNTASPSYASSLAYAEGKHKQWNPKVGEVTQILLNNESLSKVVFTSNINGVLTSGLANGSIKSIHTEEDLPMLRQKCRAYWATLEEL